MRKPRFNTIFLTQPSVIRRLGRGPHRVTRWVPNGCVYGSRAVAAWNPVILAGRTRHSAAKTPVEIGAGNWARSEDVAKMVQRGRGPLAKATAKVKRHFAALPVVTGGPFRPGEVVRLKDPKERSGCFLDSTWSRGTFNPQCDLGVIATPSEVKKYRGYTWTPPETANHGEVYIKRLGMDMGPIGKHYRVHNVPASMLTRHVVAEPAKVVDRAIAPPHKVGDKVQASECAVGDRLLNWGLKGCVRVVTQVKPPMGLYLHKSGDDRVLPLDNEPGAYTYDGKASAAERRRAGLPEEGQAPVPALGPTLREKCVRLLNGSDGFASSVEARVNRLMPKPMGAYTTTEVKAALEALAAAGLLKREWPAWSSVPRYAFALIDL